MNEQRFVSMYADAYEEETNHMAKLPDGNGWSWQYTQWLEKKLEVSEKALLALQGVGLAKAGVVEEVSDEQDNEGVTEGY